jgi:hypothetical protein
MSASVAAVRSDGRVLRVMLVRDVSEVALNGAKTVLRYNYIRGL